MVLITTMLAALIGLMFFATMASAFQEMAREKQDQQDMIVHN